jgi:hypothetical protein
MIPGFATVLAASANDRRDLFIGPGNRLGTVQQNIEKDFWVCWRPPLPEATPLYLTMKCSPISNKTTGRCPG